MTIMLTPPSPVTAAKLPYSPVVIDYLSLPTINP